MAEITRQLLPNLRPNGTVRIVFIACDGSGEEPAFTATNLSTAESMFARKFGLTPERSAGLRAQLERNTVFAVEASLDETFAAMFLPGIATSAPPGTTGVDLMLYAQRLSSAEPVANRNLSSFSKLPCKTEQAWRTPRVTSPQRLRFENPRRKRLSIVLSTVVWMKPQAFKITP